MQFETTENDTYTLIHFELNESITHEILRQIKPPKVNSTKGIILSGRGPIWLYCYLTHYYHPTKFIATYDPRIGGAVVVETHCNDYNVGDIIKINP